MARKNACATESWQCKYKSRTYSNTWIAAKLKGKWAGRQKGMGKGEKQKRKLQGSNATPSCMYLVKYYNA